MRPIAVMDLETDPFEYNKVPQPFVAEYWDGQKAIIHWGKDCVEKLAVSLRSEPASIIYAHNGGKFDFIYYLPLLHKQMRIVNGRIIQAYLGEHEFRDSFAILPFPLRDFDKDEIDYNLMRADLREANKDKILRYLHKDCTSLHELVVAFYEEFGDCLTVGGSALKQFRKFHKFDSGGDYFDEKFRKPFYYGGRNQTFKSGIIRMPMQILDINSQYPFSMKAFLHPVSVVHTVSPRIEPDTCFVVAEGKNDGAFPVRNERGGLDFTVESGVFSVSIHEFNAALDTRTFHPSRIKRTYAFRDRMTFAEFVDHFYEARRAAKKRGDKIHTLFYKYVLNSCYGKFAQNPENYADFFITDLSKETTPENPSPLQMVKQGWIPSHFHDQSHYRLTGDYIIWEKPTQRRHFYNVATGASITGAARSILLRGLHSAQDPLYCDTDSLICRRARVRQDDNELGAWKIEGTGDLAAIGGKKLYAIFAYGPAPHSDDPHKQAEQLTYKGRVMHVVKKAHKGARLTGAEILRIAEGETIEYQNPVPTFRLNGEHKFTTRRIRTTV